MRFILLTILAILPILTESFRRPPPASERAKHFHWRFLKLSEERKFNDLSHLISNDFKYVKYGDHYSTIYNKTQFLGKLRHYDLFSEGQVVSAEYSGSQIRYEIKLKNGRRNHEVVLERGNVERYLLKKYYDPKY